MRSLLIAAIGLVVGCGGDDRRPSRDAAPSDTSNDVTIRDAGPAPDIRIADSGPQVCLSGTTRVDVALDISIEQSCAIWNSLAELAGEAVVSRAGRVISIDFGEEVLFGGTVTGDEVMMEFVHAHEFTDGCGWEARETFVGRFEADCTLTLDYDYRESVAINRGGCASPCSADANVDLILTPLI